MTRRRTAPIPQPKHGQGPYTGPALEDEPVRGPQNELCKHTKCCICWAVETLLARHGVVRFYERAVLDMSTAPDGIYYHAVDLDWRDLPEYAPTLRVSDPHHEPLVSQGGTDRHTVPLCRAHHTMKLAPGEHSPIGIVRHHTTFRGFWGYFGFLRTRDDGHTVLEAVQLEMRRRAKEQR